MSGGPSDAGSGACYQGDPAVQAEERLHFAYPTIVFVGRPAYFELAAISRRCWLFNFYVEGLFQDVGLFAGSFNHQLKFARLHRRRNAKLDEAVGLIQHLHHHVERLVRQVDGVDFFLAQIAPVHAKNGADFSLSGRTSFSCCACNDKPQIRRSKHRALVSMHVHTLSNGIANARSLRTFMLLRAPETNCARGCQVVP